MRVHLLTCGSTSAPGWLARRGAGPARVQFPSLVAVVEHPDGPVVVDTGYAPRVLTALRRPADRIYGTVLPVRLAPGAALVDQLPLIGLDPAAVRTVVLTHLHADHVGGLADLPGAEVVLDPAALAEARRWRGLKRMRSGFVPALVPPVRLRDPAGLPVDRDWDLLGPARDLTGDGRVLVVPLPGHHPGHQGVLVRTGRVDLLLVGDAVWHLSAITAGRGPSRVVRVATHDWAGYAATVATLGRALAADPGLVLVPSHDADAIATARARLADGA